MHQLWRTQIAQIAHETLRVQQQEVERALIKRDQVIQALEQSSQEGDKRIQALDQNSQENNKRIQKIEQPDTQSVSSVLVGRYNTTTITSSFPMSSTQPRISPFNGQIS